MNIEVMRRIYEALKEEKIAPNTPENAFELKRCHGSCTELHFKSPYIGTLICALREELSAPESPYSLPAHCGDFGDIMLANYNDYLGGLITTAQHIIKRPPSR